MRERATKTEIKHEDYAHFLENPDDEAFSYQQLNQWQECPVQSILAVQDPSVKDNPVTSNGSDRVSRGNAISSYTISRKRRRSRRRKRMSAMYRGSVEEGNITVALGVMNSVSLAWHVIRLMV